MVKIKICGLNSEAAVNAAIAARADFAGFVYFQRSPRHVSLERAAKLKALLPSSMQSVCVLVNPDDALLSDVREVLRPHYFQLHGKESPERVVEIRQKFSATKIIKAISIRSGDDVAAAMRYAGCADMLMFDARPPNVVIPSLPRDLKDPSTPLRSAQDDKEWLPGGNGLAFDWALIAGREFPLPWFLSGGLTPDNVAQAIRVTGAAMVDVSSGVESAPGVKDAGLIKDFIKAVRQVEKYHATQV